MFIYCYYIIIYKYHYLYIIVYHYTYYMYIFLLYIYILYIIYINIIYYIYPAAPKCIQRSVLGARVYIVRFPKLMVNVSECIQN